MSLMKNAVFSSHYAEVPPPDVPKKAGKGYTPLTKDQWAAMVGKAQWDVQVALRGPDSNYGEVLKWYTTSVIRGHVRKVMRVGGTVNEDLHMVIQPSGGANLSSGTDGWNANHFLGHIETAASWLKIPVLYIPAEVWHKQMKHPSARKAGCEILELIKGAKGIGNLESELERHLDYNTNPKSPHW